MTRSYDTPHPAGGGSIVRWARDTADRQRRHMTVTGDKKNIIVRRVGKAFMVKAKSSGLRAHWSGYYKFGGFMGDKDGLHEPLDADNPFTLADITGRFIGANMTTGAIEFADDPMDTHGIDGYDWHYIADKTILNEGEEDEQIVYRYSSRTCGDVIFRTT